MPDLTIRRGDFEPLDTLNLRTRGAYDDTVTEDGPLVSDNHILFNRHFVRQEADAVAAALAAQRHPSAPPHDQDVARERLRAARDAATVEGDLLGHMAPVPALRVRAERLAAVRFREGRRGPWQYVWLDAHRLRLLTELFISPLRFFCASWDQPVVLKRGKRTVGCITPAAHHALDVRVTR